MVKFPAHIVGIFCVGILFVILFSGKALAQGAWIPDPEVTAVGKSAVRAKEFLDWTLNSQNRNAVEGINQLTSFWTLIQRIAYALTLLIGLFSAFLIIISRGQNINARKQILMLGVLLLLITFSFSLIQFLYQLTDTLQNFFLRLPNPGGITSQDLLSVSFGYNFDGFRLSDQTLTGAYDEAAKVAIFLVKATNITHYALAGILLLRKVILWFFIILSPLWVLLLAFPLVRNAAKIWVGEFFRWLLYGPLFAVLLAGLVTLWQNGIPFVPHGSPPSNYPVAINILLGGPGERVTQTDSISNINQYAKYVVSLLMLWVVILLPFLLLKIFRDAFATMFREDSEFFQKTFGALYPFLGRLAPAGGGMPPFPPFRSLPPSKPEREPAPFSPGAEGLTRQFGIDIQKTIQTSGPINVQAQVANIEALPTTKTTDIVKYAGLSIPTIADIARMEIQRESRMQSQTSLRNIANPTTIQNMQERSKFSRIQQELLTRSKRGDVAATTILAAAESARSGKPVPVVVGGMHQGAGRQVTSPLTAAKPPLMPILNRIQSVGINDYEQVKNMWEENYKTADVPITDTIKSREDWLKQDITKLESVIELLASTLEEKKKQGLSELAVILPFLLLGGFSDQETIIYLKAKLEAAKKVFSSLEEKKEEEDEKVLVEEKKEGEQPEAKEQSAEINQPTTEKPLDEAGKD